MKILMSGAAAFGLLGSAAVVALEPGEADTARTHAAEIVAGKQEPATHFQLSMPGRESTCALSKGESVSPTRTRLSLGQNCDTLLPELAEARYWREAPDGSVAFTGRNGRAIVTFAAADGLAYETFEPGSPLASLKVAE